MSALEKDHRDGQPDVAEHEIVHVDKAQVQEAAKHVEDEQVLDFITAFEAQERENPLKESRWALKLSPRYVNWALVAFASMGGFLSGLDQSVISGANLFMPLDLDLTTRENSLVNAGMPLGGIAGALLLSPINESLGRKWALIISIVFYTIGAGLEAGAVNYGIMIAGRLLLGVGVGIEGGTVPMYVAETADRRRRGNLVSLYQFNIALGEVVGYSVGAMFAKVDHGWRYMFGSSLIFSTIMLFGVFSLPESPRWLFHKGRDTEAFRSWKRLRGTTNTEYNRELYLMKASVDAEEEEVKLNATHKAMPWLDFFTEPRARRAIVYATIMVFLGQFSGCNAILYYLSVLLNQIGFNKYESNYMSFVGGAALLFGTIPGVLFMERFGRRFWGISLLPGFFIGLVLIGISYQVNLDTQLMAAEGLYLTGLIMYYGFFGSYACLTWVIPSEVYPTYLRSYGMTTSAVTLWLSAFLMTYNFSAMSEAMTLTGLTLGFYGSIAVIGWFYQILFMPETKNKTLEDIDFIFRKPTSQLVRENIASTWENIRWLATRQWGKVFYMPPIARTQTLSGGRDEEKTTSDSSQ